MSKLKLVRGDELPVTIKIETGNELLAFKEILKAGYWHLMSVKDEHFEGETVSKEDDQIQRWMRDLLNKTYTNVFGKENWKRDITALALGFYGEDENG